MQHTATHCNTLQHTATHCTTLQHTATHCNTPGGTRRPLALLPCTLRMCYIDVNVLVCNTLHHTATHCNTLQHTAPHCNTLQHPVHQCAIKVCFCKKPLESKGSVLLQREGEREKRGVTTCCSVLWCVVVCCSVL